MMQFFKKWANPVLFLFIFSLFKQTIQYLQQINVKKCPSSTRHWDSNPHESSPIATRPGLPPYFLLFVQLLCAKIYAVEFLSL